MPLNMVIVQTMCVSQYRNIQLYTSLFCYKTLAGYRGILKKNLPKKHMEWFQKIKGTQSYIISIDREQEVPVRCLSISSLTLEFQS